MVKKNYFQKLYKYDEKNKLYFIEVSLDDYNDVYDDWDPSPFKKRDIESEFNDFIINSSEDIPLKYKIGLILYLPTAKKDERKELTLISAYHNYYEYIVEKLIKSNATLTKKNLFNLFFSVFLLFIGSFYSDANTTIFTNVLIEGVVVGGWVFLWDFFTTIFFTKRQLKNEFKLYKRLLNAKISFIYID